MTKFVGFLIRFRKTVLAIMIGITAFFIFEIGHMQMYTQFLDLFPHKHPYVQIHKLYQNYFGGAYLATLTLEVKDGDVYNPETLNKMFRIQYDVDLIQGVDHFAIISIASPKVTVTKEEPYGFSTKQLMKQVPTTREGCEELRKKVLTSPHNGVLVSRDQKALLLNANFIEQRIDFNILFDEFMKIKKREEDSNHKIYLTGNPILYGWVYHHWLNKGLSMVAILVISSLIILAMLYGYMRQGGMWWWPFIGAVLCSIWGLGFSAWLGFHFDPLIIVIPFLLSARAMSHGVQWVERFCEEYRSLNGDIKQAALITGARLFPPGLIGIVADTWALLVIALTPIPILRNLAFLGTFWAGASIFTILVLFPPLFASFKRVGIPMEYKETRFDHLLKTILVKMSSWTFGTGRYITVGITVVVLIVAVFSARNLKYGDANPGDPIMWQNSEYNVNCKKINDRFPGVDQMWVVIETKPGLPLLEPDVMRGMEALKYHMMRDPNVGFVVSMADILKGINSLAHGNDPKLGLIPADAPGIQGLFNLYSMGTSPGELDPWIVPNFDASNVRLYLKNHEGSLLTEVITRVTHFISSNKDMMKNAVPKPAGGLGGILAAANEVIKTRNDPILVLILVIIFIHCSLTYGSILAGVIFTLSLIAANFLAFAYMVFKGVGLNINTFPVVSLGIGLGVDYGLYIVSRAIEVYRVEKDLEKAIKGGITTAGRAVFFTATMMTAGVIVWVFSPLRFQAEMGLLLGILMTVNMVVGVLVLPAVINIIKPKFITNPKW